MKRLMTAAATAAALVVTPLAPAGAAGSPIAAAPGSFAAGYATPVAAVQVGAEVLFVNRDFAPHDVVSVDKGPDGAPLFATAIVAPGGTTTLRGLEDLESGKTYEFFCTLHAGSMRGVMIAN